MIDHGNRATLVILGSLTFFFSAIGCVPKREKSVVLYCASDREYTTPILDSYERGNAGTEIARQYDVESSKTLGLVSRIENEKSRPRCDVFWNNEIIHTIRLQKQGILRPRRWPVPDNWPKGFKASDGSWIGFAARARVLIINKDKLKDTNEWPQSVTELASDKWHHRCGLAYPIYGTAATHMAVLASHPKAFSSDGKNASNWDQWIANVSKHAVSLSGNKQVALAVSAGELDWGLTDTDDAIIEQESGKPVAIVYPDQADGAFGTLFIPNTLSVINRSPNPNAASSLADFLISEKIESRLTMGNSAQFPVWPNAAKRSRLETSENVPRWADVDFEKAAEAWTPELMERLKAAFDH